MIHAFRVTAAAAIILFCTFWPFFPGSYDVLAVPLSMIARALGVVMLMFVPVGILWTLFAARRGAVRSKFAFAACIVAAIVWVVVSIVSLALAGPAFGIGMVAIGVALGRYVVARFSRMSTATAGTIALYLLAAPIAIAAIQLTFVPRAVAFSRDRAIRNSAPLIASIERFRETHGRYPTSLLAVWPDIRPRLRGIEWYRYEPSGDAYNLVFEQAAVAFGTREFVVYNPLDQQVVTSHTLDLLEFTGEALQRQRGFYAVREAGHPHWKYFWFD